MELQDYIQGIRTALDYPGARATYFPPNAGRRRKQNLRLAREFGCGLAGYEPADVEPILSALYGILVVSKSFDTTGVQIDNKAFLAEMRAAIEKERATRQATGPIPAQMRFSPS